MYIKIQKELLPIAFWSLTNTLDGKPCWFTYPEKMIKAIKYVWQNEPKKFIDDKYTSVMLPIEEDASKAKNIDKDRPIKVYYEELKPDTLKALRAFFTDLCIVEKTFDTQNNPVYVIAGDYFIPKSQNIAKVLMTSDKYFTAMVMLREVMPTIYQLLADRTEVGYDGVMGRYEKVARSIAGLVEIFNTEIIDLINQRLLKKRHSSGKCWYQIYINKAFIMSSTPYIAIRIVEFVKEATEEQDADAKSFVVYENYSIFDNIDTSKKVHATGTFLEDCRAILAEKTKNFTLEQLKSDPETIEAQILDFHDLLNYGPYNDKILSMEILGHINDIFGQEQWVNKFFLSVALIANKKLPIKVSDPNAKALAVDKVPQYDLFLQAVRFLDANYSKITD